MTELRQQIPDFAKPIVELGVEYQIVEDDEKYVLSEIANADKSSDIFRASCVNGVSRSALTNKLLKEMGAKTPDMPPGQDNVEMAFNIGSGVYDPESKTIIPQGYAEGINHFIMYASLGFFPPKALEKVIYKGLDELSRRSGSKLEGIKVDIVTLDESRVQDLIRKIKKEKGLPV